MRDHKAFSLVELAAAATLTLIISAALVIAIIASVDNLKGILELRTATLILQEQVSMARDLGFSEVQTLPGTFTSSSMSLLKNAAGTFSKSNYNGEPNIIRATFRIDWTTHDGQEAHKSLSTLITDGGIDKQ